MKYMLIMRADRRGATRRSRTSTSSEIIETMGRFNDEMISAGVLVAAEGLDDAAEGVVVDFSSQPPVVTDGPYGETKELFGGFWILDVASKEEAVEWAKRAPMTGPGMKTEIRRVAEHRRVPAGQRVDPEGAGVARGDRPAVTARARPRRRRGGVADRVRAHRRDARPVHRRLRARRGPRPGGAGRGARGVAARRRARRNPAGWLLTVGRRRAIDAFRRRVGARRAVRRPRPRPGEGGERGAAVDRATCWDPDRIDDDVLALMFIACHPVLSREAQVALTLRVVGGLTSDEIARAFLVPTATVQARITRAKKTLAAAQVPFEVPPPDERRERLGSVLQRALPRSSPRARRRRPAPTGSGPTSPTRRSGWPGSSPSWCPTSPRCTACSRCSS